MRPRPQEYLVRTQIGRVERKFVWHSEKPIELDLPHGWKMARVEGQIQIFDQFNPDTKHKVFIEDSMFTEKPNHEISLPSAKRSNGRRPLTVHLLKLKAPRPVYTANPTLEALHTRAPRQICAFYGQRYFLIRYRPVRSSHEISFSGKPVFSYKKLEVGYNVTAQQDHVILNVGGRKTALNPGNPVMLSEVDFFRSTILQGIHWWRIRMVPTPDGQAPLETDETEMDVRESLRLQYSTVAFLSMFGVFLFFVFLIGKLYPALPKPPHAEVTFKQAKVFPPMAAIKPPPPPPPPKPEPKKEEPPPPEPPQKVVKEKPKPKKPNKKIVAKKAPEKKPKPVAAAPTPPAPKSMAPPPPEPKVVKPPGPTPEQLLAAQQAKEQAVQQAQALKSLNFLSSSKNRPSVEPTNYESKSGKFADTAMKGGISSKSNVLDKMAKGAPGDGAITTNSSRGMASSINFERGKGLNDVQGKVSLGELVSKNGDPGGALGGGKGLELSGPGTLSESEIEKALSKFLAKFQYCYEKALLTDSGLGGNIIMQWTIGVAGRSSNERVVSSQLNNKDLQKCIAKVLGNVPFPKPKGGSVTVKKTFTFSSSSL